MVVEYIRRVGRIHNHTLNMMWNAGLIINIHNIHTFDW